MSKELREQLEELLSDFKNGFNSMNDTIVGINRLSSQSRGEGKACETFYSESNTTTATICKFCGKEKYEHPIINQLGYIEDNSIKVETNTKGTSTPIQEEGKEKPKMMLQVRHGTEWHDLPNQTEGRDANSIYRTELSDRCNNIRQ